MSCVKGVNVDVERCVPVIINASLLQTQRIVQFDKRLRREPKMEFARVGYETEFGVAVARCVRTFTDFFDYYF